MLTKNAAENINDDLRSEYDLSKLTGAVKGKYYERATAGSAYVLLEPDVAEAFPDARTVNEILRAVAKIARKQSASKAAGSQKTAATSKHRRPSSSRKK